MKKGRKYVCIVFAKNTSAVELLDLLFKCDTGYFILNDFKNTFH